MSCSFQTRRQILLLDWLLQPPYQSVLACEQDSLLRHAGTTPTFTMVQLPSLKHGHIHPVNTLLARMLRNLLR